MSISIRYFASLKEQLGRAQDTLDLAEQTTVATVWLLANPERPFPDHILTAVNMEYTDSEMIVKDGDEVAFFPPVTGG